MLIHLCADKENKNQVHYQQRKYYGKKKMEQAEKIREGVCVS